MNFFYGLGRLTHTLKGESERLRLSDRKEKESDGSPWNIGDTSTLLHQTSGGADEKPLLDFILVVFWRGRVCLSLPGDE